MKTAEEILNTKKPNQEYPSYYNEFDVIEAMDEYAEQFKSKWIKVEDELPEESGYYLTWLSGLADRMNYITILWIVDLEQLNNMQSILPIGCPYPKNLNYEKDKDTHSFLLGMFVIAIVYWRGSNSPVN